MRRISGLSLLCVLILSAAQAHSQVFFPNPSGFGGGFQFSYSRGTPGRGLRIGVGLGTPVYGVSPFVPYASSFYSPSHSRVALVSVTPPPQVIVLAPPPLQEPPPPEPRFIEPPARKVPAAPMMEEPRPKKQRPPAELPLPPAASDDPAEEFDRQVRLGREAFRVQEYGRAAQRFRRATRLRPDEGTPHFLLAQSLIAQGKYHEAEDAIVAGLERRPDWPTSAFRPREMYGSADDYLEGLRLLEELLGRHPRDPALLFVSGYALWFDARRDEARRSFQLALERGKNREAIQKFLDAAP
jgi:hypothetical protein